MSSRRHSVGAAGEIIAARFLERRGATVIGRNVRIGRDELDLVARFDGHLIAIEVKTGVGAGARPWENFDEEKADRVRRAARTLGIGRIDLISVVLTDAGATLRWSPRAG